MNRIRDRDGSSLIEWWNLTSRVSWFCENHGKEQWKCHETDRCKFPGWFVEFSFVLRLETGDKSAWLLIAWQSARIWWNNRFIIYIMIYSITKGHIKYNFKGQFQGVLIESTVVTVELSLPVNIYSHENEDQMIRSGNLRK